MIKKVSESSLPKVAEMASRLYRADVDEIKQEFKQLINSEDSVLIAYFWRGKPVAFADFEIRKDYVEGCKTNFVGYLEGIFVEPDYRGRGIGKALVEYGCSWAKQKGCTEFASDCELENTQSLAFHKAIGFSVVNKIICFKKELN